MTSTATYTSPRPATSLVLTPLRDRLRWPLAAAALTAAVAHIPVIAPHLDEAPYMGALFIVLTVGCFAIATAAVLRDATAVYALAVLTCGLAVLGYIATRTVAFPLLGDDVGNWLEPLGIVSVLSETVVVTTALIALRRRRPHVHRDDRRARLVQDVHLTRGMLGLETLQAPPRGGAYREVIELRCTRPPRRTMSETSTETDCARTT